MSQPSQSDRPEFATFEEALRWLLEEMGRDAARGDMVPINTLSECLSDGTIPVTHKYSDEHPAEHKLFETCRAAGCNIQFTFDNVQALLYRVNERQREMN